MVLLFAGVGLLFVVTVLGLLFKPFGLKKHRFEKVRSGETETDLDLYRCIYCGQRVWEKANMLKVCTPSKAWCEFGFPVSFNERRKNNWYRFVFQWRAGYDNGMGRINCLLEKR